jgi:hypothetical protein
MPPQFPSHIEQNIGRFTGRTWLLPHLLAWLNRPGERTFMLTGGPGSGKSMIMAWLAGAGPSPADAETAAQLAQVRAWVKAAHFCVAASGSTTPRALAQNTAKQLARSVPEFGSALAAILVDRVQFVATPQITTVETGGVVYGQYVELDLGDLSDEVSFDRALREPLEKLYEGGYRQPMLLLVDALDEALTYTGPTDIVRLLAKLTDLPPQVRFLVTTRPDPRVLKHFRAVEPFDLLMNAPTEVNDVRDYAYQRLHELDEDRRAALAWRIAQAAEDNFLYAHLVLEDLLPRLAEIADLATLPLPKRLSGVYHSFLNRELGADEDRWYGTFKPLLGLVAVAQGEGLSRALIERIMHKEVEQALRTCKQYLDGALPDGPFRPFHRSFTEFLLTDKDNDDYHIDAGQMHRQVADYYAAQPSPEPAKDATPWRKWDAYGVRYTPTHLADAAEKSAQPERHEQSERLVRLVVHDDFQETYKARVNDLAALQRDLEQALSAAADDDSPDALPLVVESALALVAFRRRELRPEPLFELARQGELDAAVRRLDLFDVDADWRQAAQLTLAWLATERQPDAARALRDRIQPTLAPYGPLAMLLGRLNNALDPGVALAKEWLPDAPPERIMQAMIARTGGTIAESELLAAQRAELVDIQGELLADGGFFAQHDGPLLVAFAAAHPQQGDQYLREYLSAHTNYNYVQYRNISLWYLLDAVLRHPDPGWVHAKAPELAAAALAGSTLEYQEALPLTVLGLQAVAGHPGALPALDALRDSTLAAVDELQPERGRADTWGSFNRRLGALAQVFSLLLDRQAEAATLLDRALHLPYGFAGFQSPACLTLAETIHICRPGNTPALQQALGAAHTAAHNIQDALFALRRTARFNALRGRWWSAGGYSFDQVAAAARHLRQEPTAAEFAALHRVGEPYEHRAGLDKLPIPGSMRQANTLRALAQVYERPLPEFERLNPAWAADQRLDPGTAVNVPDYPGLPALIAARLAAEALVAPVPSLSERVALIQSLAPVAAVNPTALDTVLARLLLVARPLMPSVLDAMQQLAERSRAENAPVGWALPAQLTPFPP